MKKNSLFQKAKKLQENGVNILDIEKLEIRGNLECGKGVFIETNVGKQILKFVPEKVFRLLFKGTLTIIAVKLIIDQLMLLF